MSEPVIVKRVGHMEGKEYVCDQAVAAVVDQGIVGWGVGPSDESAKAKASSDLETRKRRAQQAREEAARERHRKREAG